jgi:lipopolysaccharide/colanic/teichoic acid biosynthesis glycosyltransferase
MQTQSTGTQSAVTQKGDQRVTWIGKILRPLHFDEIPQLVNIFRGQMSFVGPRPAMVNYVGEIRSQLPVFEIRQALRPGLTGLAQITQGYSLDSPEEITKKLSFDLYYLKHYSIWLDFLILFKTAFNLARRAW